MRGRAVIIVNFSHPINENRGSRSKHSLLRQSMLSMISHVSWSKTKTLHRRWHL